MNRYKKIMLLLSIVLIVATGCKKENKLEKIKASDKESITFIVKGQPELVFDKDIVCNINENGSFFISARSSENKLFTLKGNDINIGKHSESLGNQMQTTYEAFSIQDPSIIHDVKKVGNIGEFIDIDFNGETTIILSKKKVEGVIHLKRQK